MANTKPRAVRIPDELWQAARATADQRGETVTGVLTAALRRYVKRHEANPGGW